MDLLHSGKISELLKLETEDFIFTISGDLANSKVKNLRNNLNIPARVQVNKSIYDVTILKTCTDFGNLVENNGITMMPCFFENGQYQLVLQMINNANYDIYLSGLNILDKFSAVGNIYFGVINFLSDVGYTTIDVLKNNKKVLSLTIEVFPSKIDYLKDYKTMISEINEEISALAFKLTDTTYLHSELKDVRYQTNNEFLSILDNVFESLLKSLVKIERKFKHNIIGYERICDINKAKRISNKTRSFIRAHPEFLVKSDEGIISINGERFYPSKVVEEKKITTIDIFENRIVKYMIQRIIKRLELIEKRLISNDFQITEYLNNISRKKKILEFHLRCHFQGISDLSGSKSMSLVFKMASGYKEMYKKYVMLSKGLDLGEDLFKITPKKIYTLYEMWCYIKIHKILAELGYVVEEYGILQYKDNGMYLSLLQESEAKMVYKNSKNKLELWYNKSYSLPTIDQRPDAVLHIRNISGKDRRTYIFDAKYRVSVDGNGSIGPMAEDINVMHRYRDAIVSETSDNFRYKYDTFGAYVMFPYGDEEAFKNHKFYKSIDKVNVGAFPMLPGSTKLITKHLSKLVNQSNLEAKSERLIIDEYDDYAKFKLENVMVVNVKDKKHLNAYVENSFYHVPTKRLYNVRLGIEYLAFYQSKKSFGEEGGIRYYAKIKDIVRYKRAECTEIPSRKNTEEMYLRFNLEDIEKLDPIDPIQSGPLINSYTTLYLLLNAENMHELKISSYLELEVYKVLKRIAKENNWSIRKKEFNIYLVNDNIVEIIEGKKVRVNGEIVKLIEIERKII